MIFGDLFTSINLLVLNAGNGWEWGNGMIITSDDGSFLIPYSAPVSLVITLIFCCQW